MESKEFNKVSSEHSGVRSGTKFVTIKFHHEVQGDLEEGTELILEKIAHFPTRYLLKDENGKIWTLPIHSVKEYSQEEVSAEEVQAEPVVEEDVNNESEDVSTDEKNNK